MNLTKQEFRTQLAILANQANLPTSIIELILDDNIPIPDLVKLFIFKTFLFDWNNLNPEHYNYYLDLVVYYNEYNTKGFVLFKHL